MAFSPRTSSPIVTPSIRVRFPGSSTAVMSWFCTTTVSPNESGAGWDT
jgi:hypothetical protein